ncbi:uncharacterized protein LOC117232186 [Bombus vosnesenskii]|uniref:Odorant receptor n=1 Tax=Bombus vosnesenskii TaxID=207650 RepID=A0A6J3K425_9HYME|nr:uncharacterized protein LOC117232186 [Bombus vosnesenskii]
MDWQTIEDQCLKANKFFGQLVGVWPNQEKFTKIIIRFVIFIIIITTITAQISRVVVFYSLEVLSDQMPYLDIGFVILIKQYNYVLNEKKLKGLLNDIVADRLIERPKEELEILDMYSKKATFLSCLYQVSISFCAFMFVLLPTIPPILNVVAPLNESRSREFIYPSYYFVDEQQYYYPILVHMISVAVILTSVYIACDINLVHVVHHGCALLAISGYRFKHAMDNVSFSNEKYLNVLLDETYAKISRSIDAHKKAVEYVDKVDACHVHYFFIILGLIIVTFTSTFVRLSTMEIGVRYFTFCAFTISQMTHLLFLTIMGQFLINSNDETFQAICEAKWYNGSSKAQSLYLLVLRKCLSPPKLTGGGVISLNLESFVQVLKASFSYYTVFRSA